MSHYPETTLAPILAKLERWTPLDKADRAAVLALPHTVRKLGRNAFIVREGDTPVNSCALLSGFAVRHKLAGNGGRQILSLQMEGDLVDLQNALLGRADHNLETMTAVEAAFIPVAAIAAIAVSHPEVGKAMWRETLIDASIFREWILNIGRRDARSRTAHWLCEVALRFEAAGLGERDTFDLPLTQEQLGDVLGLTAVHVNRTLMGLRSEGLIGRTQKSVIVRDWARLTSIGDFDPAYLHLHGVEP